LPQQISNNRYNPIVTPNSKIDESPYQRDLMSANKRSLSHKSEYRKGELSDVIDDSYIATPPD